MELFDHMKQSTRNKNPFNKGDRVVCLDARSYDGQLTEGKTYTVTGPRHEFVAVENDRGEEIMAFWSRFEKITAQEGTTPNTMQNKTYRPILVKNISAEMVRAISETFKALGITKSAVSTAEFTGSNGYIRTSAEGRSYHDVRAFQYTERGYDRRVLDLAGVDSVATAVARALDFAETWALNIQHDEATLAQISEATAKMLGFSARQHAYNAVKKDARNGDEPDRDLASAAGYENVPLDAVVAAAKRRDFNYSAF